MASSQTALDYSRWRADEGLPTALLLQDLHNQSEHDGAAAEKHLHQQKQQTAVPTAKPLLSPQYLETPLPWDIVVEAVSTGDMDCIGGGRSKAQVEDYKAYRDQLLMEWTSVGEYMKTEIFGFSTVVEDGKRKSNAPLGAVHRVVWRENEFPYFLPADIEHHCIWSHPKELSVPQIEEVLRRQRPDNEFEYVWFVNPPHLKSVPDVDHAHVLSRKIRKEMQQAKMRNWVTSEGGLLRGAHIVNSAATAGA